MVILCADDFKLCLTIQVVQIYIHALKKIKNGTTVALIVGKNGDALDVLDKFNKGEINHITACGMLNEGVNLKDCEVGIFANLNSSEILTIQRIGRILRHKEPKIVIPYYIHTREEELVEQMKENYNKDLIKVINYEQN